MLRRQHVRGNARTNTRVGETRPTHVKPKTNSQCNPRTHLLSHTDDFRVNLSASEMHSIAMHARDTPPRADQCCCHTSERGQIIAQCKTVSQRRKSAEVQADEYLHRRVHTHCVPTSDSSGDNQAERGYPPSTRSQLKRFCITDMQCIKSSKDFQQTNDREVCFLEIKDSRALLNKCRESEKSCHI